uniref:STPR domain-containing protein n=1 Tax=Anopheles braziliensis TaxID=58242 RepID=A0A2M3ZB44_9DIPT
MNAQYPHPPPNGCYPDIKQSILAYTMPLRTDVLDIPGPPVSLLPDENSSKGGGGGGGSQQKKKRRAYVNESEEARARRLARNAERMRQKRATETEEEYRARLAKNAESNRRKRQNETEIERSLRHARSAARERMRRAMETPEQRAVRLAKLAERMRVSRANETPEQRAIRLAKNAAKAKERLLKESPEQWIERKRKKAEYARRKRSGQSLHNSSAGSSSSNDAVIHSVLASDPTTFAHSYVPHLGHPSLTPGSEPPPDVKNIKLIASPKREPGTHVPEQIYSTPQLPFLASSDLKPPEYVNGSHQLPIAPSLQPDLYKFHLLPYSLPASAAAAAAAAAVGAAVPDGSTSSTAAPAQHHVPSATQPVYKNK